MLDFTVEVRDASLTRVGLLLLDDIAITFTDRYNNVGNWQIDLTPDHPLAAVLRTPGAGIIVTDIATGDVRMSGPVTGIQSAASADNPEGSLTITGVSDDVIAADHLAYADPTKADAAQATATEDVRMGAAETLLHQYVAANVGPSAPAGRKIPYLTMGTDGGRGGTQTQRANYPVLGTLLGSIATPAGLGFRFRQVGANIQFQTYAVTDRTATVRLDIRNNTLSSHTTTQSPAAATRVIVAGKGDSDTAPRPTVEVTTTDSLASETAWSRRIEVYQDARSTTDPNELLQQGQSTLKDKGFAQLAVQAVPMNDTTMVYGKDWVIGDMIAVVVDGAELPSIVTGAVTKADADGVRMGALIGDPAVFGNGNTGLETRVSNLERSATAGGPNTLDPASYTNSTLPSAYPEGDSVLYIDNVNGTAGGWGPYASGNKWGNLHTRRNPGTNDTEQTWHNVGNGNPDLWLRSGNTAGWGVWRQVPTDPSQYAMTGEIRMWSTSTAPSGWRLCDGAAISRTGTNAALFAVISTTFGAGDGSTTFNVPNLKGRVPVGRDAAQTEFDVLGETGGEKAHVLTQAEMPAHTHVQDAHTHTQNAHTHTQDPHSHSIQGSGALTDGPTGTNFGIQNGTFYGFKTAGTLAATATNQNTTATNQNTTATNQNTGGGGAHNNLQPYIVIQYIIKL